MLEWKTLFDIEDEESISVIKSQSTLDNNIGISDFEEGTWMHKGSIDTVSFLG